MAISRCPDLDVEVEWKPFFLRPYTPIEGTPKAPDTLQNPRVGGGMKAAGKAVGIDFTGRCDRTPNTLLAHCLLSYCGKEKGTAAQNELQELLFKAYFTDGDFPDEEYLVTAAATVGISNEDATRVFNDADAKQELLREASRNARNTSGVPFFSFNGQPAFSGVFIITVVKL